MAEARALADVERIKGRLDYIDVLRALAVLSVVSVHVYAYWDNSPLQLAHGHTLLAPIFRLASIGSWGVDLFIVISGFCLAHPLFKNQDASAPPRGLKTVAFYKRRAWRILPAYYAALMLFFLLELIPYVDKLVVGHPVNGWDLVTHVFLIQSWFAATIAAINGPFWSIALEVQLYLVFPLLLVMIRKWGFIKSIATTMLIAVVWYVFANEWSHVALSHTVGPDLSKELPARWFEFALGVGVAKLVASPRRSDLKWALLALVIGAPIAAAGESLNSPLGRDFGYGLFASGLVLACSFVPNEVFTGNVVGRSVQKLGVISFSFYLLHQPILLLLAPWVHQLHLSPFGTLALGMTGGVAACAVAGRIFFNFVERPFLVRGGMRDAIVTPGANRILDDSPTLVTEPAEGVRPESA